MQTTTQRKHRVQLTAREIEFVEGTVHAVDEWQFQSAGHFAQRMIEKRLTKDAVLDALWNGEVIEVAQSGNVVMRSKAGVCVVANLAKQYLVTCWRNDPRDLHNTLDLAAYAWKIDAVAFLKALRGSR